LLSLHCMGLSGFLGVVTHVVLHRVSILGF
jgi:hypothetical protein